MVASPGHEIDQQHSSNRSPPPIRGVAARQALQALVEQPIDDLEQPIAHDNKQGPIRSLRRHQGGWPLDVPDRFVKHIALILIVWTIVCGDSFGQWSKAQLWYATQTPVAFRQVPLNVALGETVRSIPPIDTRIDVVELEQVGPALSTPHTIISPIFARTYTVAPGDTLAALATANHLDVESLVWANRLEYGGILAVGREIRIPRIAGVPHIVAPGETLEDIARLYGVSVEAIELLAENRLKQGSQLIPGTELFIPNGHVQPPAELIERYGSIAAFAAQPAQLAGMIREPQTNLRAGPGRAYPRIAQLERVMVVPIARHEQWIKIDVNGDQGWILAELVDLPQTLPETLPETNDFPPPPVVWVWPTRGVITSPFAMRWGVLHNGIDIANQAWTPIVAARAGRVFEAGWCSGFGYCVKINHGDGIQTIYGHMVTKPKVHVGDEVAAGQFIGSMGSTYDASGGGYSTGVHLHFTIKVNGRVVDPLKYLP